MFLSIAASLIGKYYRKKTQAGCRQPFGPLR